jgi:redox-sensitive bicupin YhaK (pirin superfamily)
MNKDRVQPAQGFGTHGYRDMEIISYGVTSDGRDGSLSMHQDADL